MRTRLLAAVVALAGLLLAAGAVPAFTADSGTVNVTVAAEPPPAPCLLVSPGGVDFGTNPYSRPGARSNAYGDAPVRTESCSTAPQNVSVVGTDASGASGSWELGYWATDAPPQGNPCDASRGNLYFLGTNGSSGDPSLIRDSIAKTPRLLSDYDANNQVIPGVWQPGGVANIQLEITMPCQGSNGAGEQKSLSISLTAIVV